MSGNVASQRIRRRKKIAVPSAIPVVDQTTIDRRERMQYIPHYVDKIEVSGIKDIIDLLVSLVWTIGVGAASITAALLIRASSKAFLCGTTFKQKMVHLDKPITCVSCLNIMTGGFNPVNTAQEMRHYWPKGNESSPCLVVPDRFTTKRESVTCPACLEYLKTQ